MCLILSTRFNGSMYGEKDAVMQRFSVLAIVCSVLAVGFLSGCGDAESGLSFQGQYADEYGTAHEITETTWTAGDSSYQITQFSNETQMIIAQNDSGNEYNPDMWSRFDWAENDDGLWICQTAFNAESGEDALNTAAPDSGDPATSGCGTFKWTKMVSAGE